MGQSLENSQATPESAATDVPSVLPTALALLGFVAIAWTMLRAARRKGASARAAPADPRERLDLIRETAKKRSSETYQAEAMELTRRLAAQLDAKARALEELIAEADERLARLESTSDRPLATLAGRVGGADDKPAGPRDDPHDGSGGDAMRREVFRLADEGLDSVEIAQKLQQPIGQVRLILALRRA